MKSALTFHASFDAGLDADFSTGGQACLPKKGKVLVPCVPNDEVKLSPEGKFGTCSHLESHERAGDLGFAWDPAQVALVLGASYMGHLDDLAVFNQALSDAEVKQLFGFEKGVPGLRCAFQAFVVCVASVQVVSPHQARAFSASSAA